MAQWNKIAVRQPHGEQVLELILDAPKGNVLDSEMMAELTRAFETEVRADSVKAVVIKSSGPHFSFGASVPEHQADSVASMLGAFHGLFRKIIEASRPTIAVVRGQCLGGGLELAAFCNWIFCDETAHFGQPEVQLAVFPPVASLILPRLIGQAAADDLVLTGRSIDAEEAKSLGLVRTVSPDPDADVERFLEQHILPRSAAALRHAVAASRHELNYMFLHAIDEVERSYLDDLMSTHDANEGIAAFMEKRNPDWSNR